MTQEELNKKLWDACKAGNLDQVKEAVQDGSEINNNNKIGETPLHCAAMHGHLDISKYLVENGADVDATTKWGNNTPFHWAQHYGHKELEDYFIEVWNQQGAQE